MKKNKNTVNGNINKVTELSSNIIVIRININ